VDDGTAVALEVFEALLVLFASLELFVLEPIELLSTEASPVAMEMPLILLGTSMLFIQQSKGKLCCCCLIAFYGNTTMVFHRGKIFELPAISRLYIMFKRTIN
jgi:hypothetical protein